MQDTTKEALIEARNSIAKAQTLALREVVENPKLALTVLERVGQFAYWIQTIDMMVDGPKPERIAPHEYGAPQEATMIRQGGMPRGPAW